MKNLTDILNESGYSYKIQFNVFGDDIFNEPSSVLYTITPISEDRVMLECPELKTKKEYSLNELSLFLSM